MEVELDLNSKKLLKEYILIFLGAVVLYVISCGPSVVWQDSGMIQYRVLNNDIRGGLGLALAHPLYYLIAIFFKYIPIGDLIYRINIVSSLAAAFTVANIYLLIRNWFGRIFPALITAIVFAVSHTFWRHASLPETYTLYACFLSAELVALESYFRTSKVSRLYLVALFNGLAIATHMLGSISLACYGVILICLLLKKKLKLSSFLIFVAVWIVGALPYEYLIVEEFIRSGDLVATLKSAAFGRSWQHDVLNPSLSVKIIRENIMYMGMNFPTPLALFAFAGLYFVVKDSSNMKFGIVVVVLTMMYLGFAFRYTVPDRYAFFIPFYLMMAVLIGIGIARLNLGFKPDFLRLMIFAFAFCPAVIYVFLPGAIESYYPIFKNKRQLPYRNDYKYFLQPWKTSYYGARRFGLEALNAVPEDAIVFSDGTALYPLVVTQKLNGLREDVKILSGHGSYDNLKGYSEEEIIQMCKDKSAYVVTPRKGYCPQYLLDEFDFEQTGVLYRIKEKTQE